MAVGELQLTKSAPRFRRLREIIESGIIVLIIHLIALSNGVDTDLYAHLRNTLSQLNVIFIFIRPR